MEEELVSKSERKRQALRLQALGKALTALKRPQLEALPLPEQLAHAIFEYQRFTSHEARRRQLQFIGRLMRDFDATALEAALADLRGESDDARYRMHQAEQWRERLLADPTALKDFFDAFPDADRQALRQALTRAQKPATETQHKTATRALFRLIREQIPEDPDTPEDDHQDA